MKDRLRELRIKNNYSQKDLAKKLFVTQQTVSKWENTDTTPELDLIIKLSKLYKVSTDYIVTGSESTNNFGQTLINVYNFDSTEDKIIKYRKYRITGSMIGLITTIIFLLIHFILSNEINFFGVVVFIIFFFSLRISTISNDANYDVPENRLKDASMTHNSFIMIVVTISLPLILLITLFFDFMVQIYTRNFYYHYFILFIGGTTGGLFVRQFKLFVKNKVRKEQKSLDSCKEVIFNPKYNAFDVIGRIACIILLLISVFTSII